MKKKSDPTPIQDVVNHLISEMSEGKRSFESEIIDIWPTIVGDEVSSHTKPSQLKGKILFVLVDTPPWLVEIRMKHMRRILKKIQELYGKEKVQKIRFDIGNFK